MREAFTYMFKDNKFYQKYFTYLGLAFAAYFLINYAYLFTAEGAQTYTNQISFIPTNPFKSWGLLILGLTFKILTAGYFLNTIAAISKQNDNYILPFFNTTNCLTKGLKLLGALLFIIFCFTILLFLSAGFKPLTLTLILIFSIIFCASFLWIIANENKYLVLLHIEDAVNYIKKASKNYFKYLFVFISAFVVSTSLSLLAELFVSKFNAPILEIIAISIIYAIIDAYFIYVYSFLIAKSIKPESVV